ncbi:hypothetical protein HED49_16865 [Ochrobactrum daejeonense]|nr:hypothetical protein [Brucella daejeonensis]
MTGTFDTLDQNMPFVDLALAYDANHVYIDAARNNVAFCDVARTFNQCSTGNGLESTGAGNPVYDAVAALPDEEIARYALDQLSGEVYASAKSALIDDSHFVRDAVSRRIRSSAIRRPRTCCFWGMVRTASGRSPPTAPVWLVGAMPSAHGVPMTAMAMLRAWTPPLAVS